MVHHISLGAETLPAALRALEGSMVVVHPHVNRQVMSVVERFFAGGHSANKVSPRLVVGKVNLQELRTSELFLAGLVAALKDLCASLVLQGRISSIVSLKTHLSLPLAIEGEGRRVGVRVF